ncbi:plastid-lipid associated protein PAP / fibrillinfamily protein [Striga asiatica]|uniref:Plastid-lipid associated protein PAP / fibrillinfamily protein n=1 Tax=Striga asiatica TaxID=4170 RepID=A0A5A7PFF8_STRAF|nr:plastid-lipid associated protein PAP / fibrillinfamily protein [Striga asiatica]
MKETERSALKSPLNHKKRATCRETCTCGSGKDGVFLDNDDITDVMLTWGFCLVGYFTQRHPGKEALLKLCNDWKVQYDYVPNVNGWILFKFKTAEDRAKVLAEGPYQIYGRGLILKELPRKIEGIALKERRRVRPLGKATEGSRMLNRPSNDLVSGLLQFWRRLPWWRLRAVGARKKPEKLIILQLTLFYCWVKRALAQRLQLFDAVLRASKFGPSEAEEQADCHNSYA